MDYWAGRKYDEDMYRLCGSKSNWYLVRPAGREMLWKRNVYFNYVLGSGTNGKLIGRGVSLWTPEANCWCLTLFDIFKDHTIFYKTIMKDHLWPEVINSETCHQAAKKTMAVEMESIFLFSFIYGECSTYSTTANSATSSTGGISMVNIS